MHGLSFVTMAPEQVRGLPQDERTIVYQIGALLHAMLTGTYVHERATDFRIIEAVRGAGPVPPPSSLAPAVSPALDQIVLRAMAPNPADRFATVDDLATALTQTAPFSSRTDLQGGIRATLAKLRRPPQLAPFLR